MQTNFEQSPSPAARGPPVRASPAHADCRGAGVPRRAPKKCRGLCLGSCTVSRPVMGAPRRIIPLKLKCRLTVGVPGIFLPLDPSARVMWWQIPASCLHQGSLVEAEEHPAISHGHQGSGTWSMQTLPRMDTSPPVTSNFPTRSFRRLLEVAAGHVPFCWLRYPWSRVLLEQSYPLDDAGHAALGPVQPG